MERTQVKIGGFGGQGVILSAIVVGKAATIFDEKYATLTQSFGPEARGSACSAQLILSDLPILYPYVKDPDILMVMSQEAYDKFTPGMDQKGILIVEEDLVTTNDSTKETKLFKIPATRIAEEIGRKQVLNIVMVGFFTAVTGLISEASMKQAVEHSIPPGTEKMNLMAYQRGYEHGLKLVK